MLPTGTTCRVCCLPPALRDEANRRLTATQPESGAKVSAWLKASHDLDIRGPSINEHRRRHLVDPVDRPQSTPSATTSADPTSPSAPPAAPAAASATVGAQPPAPPVNPEIAFIDSVLNQAVVTYYAVSGSVQNRIAAVTSATEPVVLESQPVGGKGGGGFQPAGPTKPEADFLGATLSGIASLIKTRHAIRTGAGLKLPGSSGKPAEAEIPEGLKALFKAAPSASPERPPRIDGDAPDPVLGEEIGGYEPAAPEEAPPEEKVVTEEKGEKLGAGGEKPAPQPRIPAPPASGPRVPLAQPVPLRRAAGMADAFNDDE